MMRAGVTTNSPQRSFDPVHRLRDGVLVGLANSSSCSCVVSNGLGITGAVEKPQGLHIDFLGRKTGTSNLRPWCHQERFVKTAATYPGSRVAGAPKASVGLLAQFHQKPGEFPRIPGLAA
jgi:hypothetical protein